MGDCNDQGSTAGPCDPPTIVPDSIRVSVAAGPSPLFRENDAAPPAACFVDQSHSSRLPLLVTNKPPYPADGADVEGRSSMILSPDPTVVLPAGDASAARLPDDNAPNNGGTVETPQGRASGLDPLQLPPLPEVDASPELPPQPRPGSSPASPSKQNTGGAVYSAAFKSLVRQVGAASATRPSLCACKKLAVAAMLSDDDDGKGGAMQRPGRVCANRGKEADCLYRAFNDAPIVPSTTVSNKTLSLLLHMRKSDPAAPTEGKEGEGVEEAGGNGGDDKRDDDPGGGAGGPKERGEGTKEEQSSGGVGEGEDRRHARGATASSDKSEGEGDPSSDKGKVVLVEIRRWLMDCVASVHCADGALREAMSRLVPPELGQTHLSPDGGGLLIALHVAAVTLLVESLPTLPGVVKVEGADNTAGIFTSAQAVPPTAITPARRPVSASACSQQPGARLLPRQHSSSSRKMAAPVPIRASEMVAPSIWDLANMGGGGTSNGNSRVGGGAAVGGSSGVHGSGVGGQHAGGASSHAGGLGFSGATAGDILDGDGIGGTAAAMMSADSTLLLFSTDADQQLPGWGNKAGAAAPAWPTAGSRSRDFSNSGDGAGGGGGDIGGTWTAHGSGNDAEIYRQGHQEAPAPSVVSSHSSSSSGSYDSQYAEAAASKRQKTDSSAGMGGVARPVGQHLQGYASLFSGDANGDASGGASGNTFGGALAYSASSKLGDSGIGGIGLGDLAGDSFGTINSGVDVGSAWVDAVFDSESASSSSPFLLNDK